MSDEEQAEGGMRHIGDVVGNLFPAGQLPKTTPPAKAKKTVKQPENRKAATAAKQILQRPDEEELAFISREFVQCSLPYRNPGKVEAWVRRNGNFTLIIQPGFDADTMRSYGLPFGENAKLLSIWLETEAVSYKNSDKYQEGLPATLSFGPTFKEFLLACGCNLETGRGKRGAGALMQDQMYRFFNARFSFQYAEGNEVQGGKTRTNMNVAKTTRYWWDFKNPDQGGLFESQIVLDPDFFEAITTNPVPIDLRAVIALKNSISQSAFALDLYIWLMHRLHRMGQSGQAEIAIPLEALQEQFGAGYGRLLDFKKAFIRMLLQVQLFIPEMSYSFEKHIFILRRGKGPAALAPAPPQIMPPGEVVGEEAIDQFRREFPGKDVYPIISEFYHWRQEKGEKSANTNAHFMSFARSWIQNRTPGKR